MNGAATVHSAGSHAAAGVILAGGRSTRMGGGDKSLRLLAGRPILAHVIERARPQVVDLVLNANRDVRRFAAYGLPVVSDSIEGFAGPLAGVLAGMDWAAGAHPTVPWVISFPGDAPFVPVDLAARLFAAVGDGTGRIACAQSAGRLHPVCALWPVAIREALRVALADQKMRKVETFMRGYRLATVEFSSGDLDPFYNINTEQDLKLAEARLASAPH